jgi:glucan phosphoethanolaminetransferase (alkaline phosphatase superfamily)
MRYLVFALLTLPARWRWLIWTCYVLSWTTALLMPSFAQQNLHLTFGESTFLIAKTVHVTAYAVLAVLTGWLGTRGRLRWGMFAFLLVHAAGTECLQYAMNLGREGSPRDVLLNLVGIGLGMAVSWKWWR